MISIDIRWARVKQDVISVQVQVDLMEAAGLIRGPSQVVWTSSWGSTYNGIASGMDDLPAVVRSVTRAKVNDFVRFYERARAR